MHVLENITLERLDLFGGILGKDEPVVEPFNPPSVMRNLGAVKKDILTRRGTFDEPAFCNSHQLFTGLNGIFGVFQDMGAVHKIELLVSKGHILDTAFIHRFPVNMLERHAGPAVPVIGQGNIG